MSKSVVDFIAVLVAATGIAAASPAGAVTPVGGLGNAKHVTIWVPDYYGHNVFEYKLDFTNPNSPTFSSAIVKLVGSGSGKACNPNAIAVHSGDLYIVCNSAEHGPDEVQVYNASSHAYKKRITGIGLDGKQYFHGSQLIAILFDNANNLWVSGYGTNDLLRVPASQLSKSSPKIDREVQHSPDMPAGLAMDPSDHSIWVVGQSFNGIVVNFPSSVLNAPSNNPGVTVINPPTSFCMSSMQAPPPCQTQASVFDNPEGVAVFDGAIWVSNNGGNNPGKTIVRLVKDKLNLTDKTFGEALSQPFACPGGMFAVAAPSGGAASLWINDEGYKVTGTHCGGAANGSDTGSHIGGVLQYLADDLLQHQQSPQQVKFFDWEKITTSSPGFGGVFVQMN